MNLKDEAGWHKDADVEPRSLTRRSIFLFQLHVGCCEVGRRTFGNPGSDPRRGWSQVDVHVQGLRRGGKALRPPGVTGYDRRSNAAGREHKDRHLQLRGCVCGCKRVNVHFCECESGVCCRSLSDIFIFQDRRFLPCPFSANEIRQLDETLASRGASGAGRHS